MIRIVLGVFLIACWWVPTGAWSQYGVPAGVRAVRKPTGTSCRTVQTVVEVQPDASCGDTGKRAYEVKELECSHFRSGTLDRRYAKFERRAGDCVDAHPAQ